MKKRTIALICCIALAVFALAACGGSDSKYAGTWKATKAAASGIEVSIDAIGEITLTLENGGDGTFSYNGQSESISWEESSSGITLKAEGQTIECPIEDNTMTLEYSGATITLEKQ